MGGVEDQRWTFTASGLVTVKAARLAAHARAGQILLGEETARRIQGHFPLSPLGRIPLKNLEDSGEVFEAAPAAD
ncbi:MAG: hypothetical protein JRH05_03385 [Deltaproteobacteria bacterium]|nr:hypothetical protein [Deltaproteobacteria bacterium]MBW2101710.1 hypothetical protein [Deltaproteobacteria bacterium]